MWEMSTGMVVILPLVILYVLRCIFVFCFDLRMRLHFIRTRFNDELVRRCPALSRTYRPHFGMTCIPGIDYFLQTAKTDTPLLVKRATLRLQKVELPGGGTLGLQWLNDYIRIDTANTTPIVISFPPVGSCSPYGSLSGALCHEVSAKLGYRVVQVVYQGLGGLPLTSKQLPSSAYCGLSDSGEAIRSVHAAYPDAKIMILGCSIGSAMFTRWAGCNPEKCKEYNVIGCVNCGHGFSVQETTECGDATHWGFPGKRVVGIWKGQLQDTSSEYLIGLDGVDGFSTQALLDAKMSAQWDEAVMPLYGYANREDMFLKCDAVHVLQDLCIPSLFVNAEDDPVCPAARMRRKEKPVLLNHPMVLLLSTQRGGHLGWHDGYFVSQRRWIRDVVCEYFRALVEVDESNDLIKANGLTPQ